MAKIPDGLGTKSPRASRNWCLSILVLCLADFLYFKMELKGASSNVRCLHVIVACIGMWCMYLLFSARKMNGFGEVLRTFSCSFGWGAAAYAAVASFFLVAFDHDLRMEFLSPTLVFHAVTFGLSAGTIEEIIFRGLLLSLLLKVLRNRFAHPLIIATVIEVVLFTSSHYHVARLKTYYLVPFAWGIYLTMLTLRSGTLWPAFGVHAGYNAIQVIATGVHRPGFAKLRGIFSVDPSLWPKFFLLLSIVPIISIAVLYRNEVRTCVLRMIGRDRTVNDVHINVSSETSLIGTQEFMVPDPKLR